MISRLWRWIGADNEQIKIIFALVAATWIIVEYRIKQHELRVERTVSYVKKATEDKFIEDSIKLTRGLLDPDMMTRLESVEGDKEKYAKIMKEFAEKNFSETWRIYNFYNDLATCVNENLCDSATACRRFHREISVFVSNTAPYFDDYHKKYHDDAFKAIRKMQSDASCIGDDR
jgi:hypothetical protein